MIIFERDTRRNTCNLKCTDIFRVYGHTPRAHSHYVLVLCVIFTYFANRNVCSVPQMVLGLFFFFIRFHMDGVYYLFDFPNETATASIILSQVFWTNITAHNCINYEYLFLFLPDILENVNGYFKNNSRP